MKKRVFKILLMLLVAVMLVVGIFVVSAFADEEDRTLLTGSDFQTEIGHFCSRNSFTEVIFDLWDDKYDVMFDWNTAYNSGACTNGYIDVTQKRNGNVKAFADGTKIYVLTKGSEGTKIVLNEDSSNMFFCCRSVKKIDMSKCDTSSVTNFHMMFNNCNALDELYLTGWNTSAGVDFGYMFNRCFHLAKPDVAGFDMSNAKNLSYMFCSVGSACEETVIDVSEWKVKPDYMDAMFSLCPTLKKLDLSGFDTSNVTDMMILFAFDASLTVIDLSSFDTSNVTNMFCMFALDWDFYKMMDPNWSELYDCLYIMPDEMALEKIIVGPDWDTTSVTGMINIGIEVPADYCMFGNCTSLPNYNPACMDSSMATLTSEGGCLSIKDTLIAGNDLNKYFTLPKEEETLGTTKVVFGIWVDENKDGKDDNYGFSWEDGIDVTENETGIYRLFRTGDPKSEPDIDDDDLCTNPEDGETVYILTKEPERCFFAGESLAGLFGDLAYLSEIEGLDLIDTTDVTDMHGMFQKCEAGLTSLDLSGWDVSNVESMVLMFADCQHLETLVTTGWDTSKVENMGWMFAACRSLSDDSAFKDFDTSSVTNMSHMCAFCPLIKEFDLSGWNVEKVTDMTSMFDVRIYAIEIFGETEENWVEIKDAYILEELLGFDSSQDYETVIKPRLIDILNDLEMDIGEEDPLKFIEENVFLGLGSPYYYGSITKRIDLSGWDPQALEKADQMFDGQVMLQTIFATFDLSDRGTTDADKFSALNMFRGCSMLLGQNGTRYNSYMDESEQKFVARLDKAASNPTPAMPGFFTDKTEAEDGYNHTGDWSDSTRLKGSLSSCIPNGAPVNYIIFATLEEVFDVCPLEMLLSWGDCPDLTVSNNGLIRGFYIPDLDGDGTNDNVVLIISATDEFVLGSNSDQLFYGFEDLVSIIGFDDILTQDGVSLPSGNTAGLALIDVSESETFSFMFYKCSSLTSIVIPETWDTSTVSDVKYMFYGCSSLSELDIDNFDFSNVTGLYYTFWGCSSLTSLTFPEMETAPKLTTIAGAFEQCSMLTSIDLSMFDLTDVENMACSFDMCFSLTSIKFPEGFTAAKVESFEATFALDISLTELDLTGWTVEEATNMDRMFAGCFNLASLKIPDFETSNVENMTMMFLGLASLEKLVLPEGFDTTKCTDFEYMFAFDLPLKKSKLDNNASDDECQNFFGIAELMGFEVPDPVQRVLDLSVMTFGEHALSVKGMFQGNTSVQTIFVSEDFETTLANATVTSSAKMFEGCTNLVGMNGFAYDENADSDHKNDATYAKLNTPTEYGYFTYNFGNVFTPGYMNLTLDGQIGVAVYLKLNDKDTLDENIEEYLKSGTKWGVVFRVGGTPYFVDWNAGVDMIFGTDTYRQFIFYVNPDEMSENITFFFGKENGHTLTSVTFTTSVVTYANKILTAGVNDLIITAQVNGLSYGMAAEKADEAVELIKAMLDYGTAAEIYREKGTSSNRPNKGVEGCKITSDSTNIYSGVTLSDIDAYFDLDNQSSVNFIGFNLDLSSTSAICIYFKLANEEDTATAGAYISRIEEATSGTLYQIDEDGKIGTVNDDMLVVRIENIAAANIDKVYRLTVTVNEKDVATLDVNMLAYVKQALGDDTQPDALRNLLAALYYYNVAANNYFD